MTFKIKNGLQVGSTTVVDQNSFYQQTESLSSVAPSLVLDFTRKTLDERITFARTSAATYVGPNKYIQTAAAGVPRFDHDPITGECKGLVIESQSVNLVVDTLRPGAIAIGNGVEYFGYSSPAGDYTASRIKAVTNTSATKYAYRFELGSVGNGTYTASVYVKYVDEPNIYFRINDQTGGNGALQQFNVQTGVAVGSVTSHGGTGSTAAIYPAGNGWYRIALTTTFSSSPTQIHATVFLNAYGSTTAMTAVDTWGFQIENQSWASSFVSSTDTFTSRSSTATYFDSTDGLLKTAAINTSRPFFNPISRTNAGILIEPAVTNQLNNTEAIVGNTAYCTITTDATVAPDGTTTADKLVETAGNPGVSRQAFRSANTNLMATTGTYNTFSVFAKAAGRSKFQLDVSDAIYTSADNATFDLYAGTVTYSGQYSANIIPYPNGWYRCSLTAKVVTSTGGGMFINMMDDAGNGIYTGDGTSGLYLWGFQAEIGQYPTSYIPATSTTYVTRAADVFSSATTTRAADTATIAGADFNTGWYNRNEGTCFADWYEGSRPAVYGVFSLHNNYAGPLERLDIRRQDATYLSSFQSVNALNRVVTSKATNYSYGQRLKAGIAYKANNSVMALSGSTTLDANTSSASIPTPTTLQLGGIDVYTSYPHGGWLRSFVYYPIKLSNTTILAILSQEN